MGRWVAVVLLGTAVVSGCAGPITQVGSVSQADVHAEQQEQLRLAAQTALANQQRVERLAAPLLDAAAPLCGKATQVNKPKRSSTRASLVVPTTGVCTFQVLAQRGDQLNAAADGNRVFVETALLRFTSDEELSVVLAHEIAHNAMHHRDAQMKNALGGALLGAVADIAMAAGGKNTGGQYTKMGAEAGGKAFSQDFEREADYVGLYILAWAGLPVDRAASFWRRMAVEHPAGIMFATTHPTSAERFVRLEQWAREVNVKLASGDAFGPEMKDQRRVVASRVIAPEQSVSNGDVALAAAPERSSSLPLGVDAGPKPAFAAAPTRVATSVAEVSPAKSTPSISPAAIAADSDDERFARATIGAPRSEADRAAAMPAYERGMAYLGAHNWGPAKAQFKEALRLDGSVAAYHAALADVLFVEEDWAGAAAEYSAAVLIDVDNEDYRARLKEARARK